MENSKLIQNNPYEVQIYKCERCKKNFKTKSSLSRHGYQTHSQVDLLQMKMKNEQLKLNIQLYMEQIKFLKELILIQETFRNPVIRPIGMNQQHPSSAIKQ